VRVTRTKTITAALASTAGAVALAAATIGGAPAGSSTLPHAWHHFHSGAGTASTAPLSPDLGAGNATVLHFSGVDGSQQDIDLAPSGFSAGDEFLFDERLSGACTGHDWVQGTLQAGRQVVTYDGTFFCSGKGQFTIKGAGSVDAPETQTLILAVTGGTGQFRTARGELVVHPTNTGATFDLRLFP